MSFLDRFFGNQVPIVEPDLRFGRYSDIYKQPERYEAWDRSLLLFEQKKYIESYREFFKYLGDEKEGNVTWREEEEKLIFQFFQGSKEIKGEANRVQIKAEARIAGALNLEKSAFFRELLERNFDLEYCRFALDTNKNLTVVFDSSTLDGSPFKLYHALREMALQADKQDDLLLERYPQLQPINNGHVEDLPESEKLIKYTYAKQLIQEALDTVIRLEEALIDYPGGISYLLLSLCYKLDYLLTPQGQVTDTLERIHRGWFANDKKTTDEKNQQMRQEFETLLNRPQAAWFSEFYRVISTFGIVPAFGHDRIENIAEAELPVFDWYAEHGYPEVALAIADYIVGHSQFSFALPRADRDLFHLYFRIMNSEFFKSLGFSPCCSHSKEGKFFPKEIKRQIRRIVEANEDNYLSFQPDTSLLNYDNKIEFVRSYLLMVKGLKLVQVR